MAGKSRRVEIRTQRVLTTERRWRGQTLLLPMHQLCWGHADSPAWRAGPRPARLPRGGAGGRQACDFVGDPCAAVSLVWRAGVIGAVKSDSAPPARIRLAAPRRVRRACSSSPGPIPSPVPCCLACNSYSGVAVVGRPRAGIKPACTGRAVHSGGRGGSAGHGQQKLPAGRQASESTVHQMDGKTAGRGSPRPQAAGAAGPQRAAEWSEQAADVRRAGAAPRRGGAAVGTPGVQSCSALTAPGRTRAWTSR